MPPGACIGQTDVPLTDRGRRQAQQAVLDWPGEVPQTIYCSDLLRARETADSVARAFDLTVVPDRRLRELDFGAWENRSWDAIYKNDPELMEAWGERWLDTAPPGGETAEALYHRVSDFYAQLVTHAPGSLVVVAHAGSLRALKCLVQGDPPQAMFKHSFQHARPIRAI